MNEAQREFTLKLIQNAQAELSMATYAMNYERVDILTARVNALKLLLEENEE